MGIINAIFQAIIQGLTEFLPVSSSGHLSLYQHFTGNSGEGALFFSAILHLGTLVAVFVAFRKTIWDMIKELGVMIKDIFTGKFTLKNMNPPRRMIVMIIVSCFCHLRAGLRALQRIQAFSQRAFVSFIHRQYFLCQTAV